MSFFESLRHKLLFLGIRGDQLESRAHLQFLLNDDLLFILVLEARLGFAIAPVVWTLFFFLELHVGEEPARL